MKIFPLLTLLFVVSAVQLANAQSTWGGAGTDQNWSTLGNWSAGGVPSSSSTVTFPDGAFPITTNTQGAVNNIVDASTTIASLTCNNLTTDYDTTLIPSGSTLTISGNLLVGASDAASMNTVVTMTGGGSLIAGTNGTSTLTGQNGSGQGSPSVLDLSGLSIFVFNFGASSPGSVNFGTGGSGSAIQVYLAAASNNITASTFNVGNNNTRGANTLNLGNGTNIINADTIIIGQSKTSGTMQFNNNAGGDLTIADHTGTGRANINLGTEGSSGSTTTVSTGNMLFNGGTVNILAGTLIMANRANRADSPGALAVLSFNNGTVDATTINMAINTTGGSPSANLSVGGPGVLKIGSGGLSLVNEGGTAGAGTLIITNGGTVICSNSIYKTTSTGVGTITISDSSLSVAGTIGATNYIPIDNFNLTNSILTVPANYSASVFVANFNPDVTNTINISSMPTISSYPAQFQIISYTTPGGNLNSIGLGTLPTANPPFAGYILNNSNSYSIDLVITNGPVAKADEWGGGTNNKWDTTSLNWTNNGAAVTYNDLDLVTFDDFAQTNNVNITAARTPASLTFNNSVLNYTITGNGNISGPVQLVMYGNASVKLAEAGGDDFSGGVAVYAGSLVLDDASSAISGGLTIGYGTTVQIGNNDMSGTLPSGTLDDEGTLVFDRSDKILVTSAIPGGGALTQSGSGTLILGGVNTYFGNTIVTNGTLALTNSGSISSSLQVGVSDATLDVSGVSGSTTLNELDLTNASLDVKVGYLQTNLNLTSLNMGGVGNTINVQSLPPIVYYPTTVALLHSANLISGYNFTLGSLPSASPAYAGTITESGDQTTVLLTLTSGPTNTRPSVVWSGIDALNNVNTNWSDALNWQTPGVPTATEKVTFDNTAVTYGSPFDIVGDGSSGIVYPGNINNIVDVSITNAALSYANTVGGYHNTRIAPGQTLTVNGSLTVSGSGGVVTILGTNAALIVNNPNHGTTINVEGGTAPILDMSGLDAFTAAVSQIGVGYNTASSGSGVNGTWYLARTNTITTAAGFSGVLSSLVVGSANSQSALGTGTIYLGQSNTFYVDGILLGLGPSTGDLIAFNPVLTNNPVAHIRGITGDSSRVTTWSLGDYTVNLNNHVDGYGHVSDFSAGTLDALVGTLIVGQGAQGNEANSQVMGTFNMGAGNLDVTTLNVGVSGVGTGGTGIGIMNVKGGTLVVNSLGLGLVGGGGGIATTMGTINLTNATLVVSNGISLGSGTAGGTINDVSSTVKILGGDTISNNATIMLDAGGILDVSALTDGTLTLTGGPTLAGNGTVNGSLVADVGSTVSPGASVGVLTVTNNLTLLGTTVMEVDQGNGTNDLIRAAQTINYGGTLSLTNLSGTLTTNDSFKLFDAAHYHGTYTGITGSPGDGLAWDPSDLAVNGTIKVTTLVVSAPTITGISLSGTTLTITATNGTLNGQYVLLGTTNLTTPLSGWTPILTNSFDSNGNLNLSTNIIDPDVPQQFYILSQ